MPTPTFQRLNTDWHAEWIDPDEEVRCAGSEVALRFRLALAGRRDPVRSGKLVFPDCSVWRVGSTNEHGWYLGQCRYGRAAPSFGDFYELLGDDDLKRAPNDWEVPPVPGHGERHFLFYLRDSTFECIAGGWSFTRVASDTGREAHP